MSERNGVPRLHKAQLDTLTRIDARAGWRHLLAHGGLILGCVVLTLHVSWLFSLALGLCLGALFPLMHEATHRHVLASPRGNAHLALICGAVLLVPATWFRYFHQAHHRYTQDPERDPELAQPRPATRAAYLWHLTGIPAWVASVTLLAAQATENRADPFVPQRAAGAIRREARGIILCHFILLTAILLMAGIWGAVDLLWVSYIPLAIGQVFLRFFLLAEHGGLPFVDRVMENTRSTRAAAWLRWLTWNMSFHVEHHANPAVPHDKLPEFHKILETNICPSYGQFHRTFWRRISPHATKRSD